MIFFISLKEAPPSRWNYMTHYTVRAETESGAWEAVGIPEAKRAEWTIEDVTNGPDDVIGSEWIGDPG